MSFQKVVRSLTRHTLGRQHNLVPTGGLSGVYPCVSVTGRDIHREKIQEVVCTHYSNYRGLSTTAGVANDLGALISREIKEENDSDNIVMPADLKELMEQVSDDWRIISDSATIQMFKKEPISSGGKVSLSFHCQDSISMDDMLPDDEELFAAGEEEEHSVAFRFQVRVTRAGKTLVMNCVSMDSETSVERVFLDKESMTSNNNNTTLSNDVYQGPEFVELAQDVQDSFTEFVQTDCGVNENVAAFVSMYSDYKEQTEYVDWLNGVKSIINP